METAFPAENQNERDPWRVSVCPICTVPLKYLRTPKAGVLQYTLRKTVQKGHMLHLDRDTVSFGSRQEMKFPSSLPHRREVVQPLLATPSHPWANRVRPLGKDVPPYIYYGIYLQYRCDLRLGMVLDAPPPPFIRILLCDSRRPVAG